MTNKKRIGLAVPARVYEYLKDEAVYTGQTLNSLILQILWAHVNEKENTKIGI